MGDDTAKESRPQWLLELTRLCEHLETEAYAALEAPADGRSDHELGYYRGQKATAKSIRRAMHKVAR
jgi:hypothetical protein